eukprot:COSAG06_NODE_10332_length_1700_cov_2.635853_3_plen_193_part_00
MAAPLTLHLVVRARDVLPVALAAAHGPLPRERGRSGVRLPAEGVKPPRVRAPRAGPRAGRGACHFYTQPIFFAATTTTRGPWRSSRCTPGGRTSTARRRAGGRPLRSRSRSRSRSRLRSRSRSRSRSRPILAPWLFGLKRDYQFGVHLSHTVTPLPPIENFPTVIGLSIVLSPLARRRLSTRSATLWPSLEN